MIDSRTSQVRKVACMSCIRGHRSNSCGIPVCRTKVFWTVKRPGRPSNSCTCRYGATEGCRCVMTKSACPHKPKKGEKRSVDCRCDEQGRFCCLLELEHWDALTSLQNPTVDFYPSREALDERHTAGTPRAFPPTPVSYSANTPQPLGSQPNTPGSPQTAIRSTTPCSAQFTKPHSPAPVPRFGLMGVGTPWGSEGHHGENVLIWEGQAPPAPRKYQSYSGFKQPEPYSCFNQPDPSTMTSLAPPAAVPSADYSYTSPSNNNTAQNQFQDAEAGVSASVSQPGHLAWPTQSDHLFQNQEFAPVTQCLEAMSMLSQEPPSSAFGVHDKLMQDFYNYPFPSSICQSCGLNGCSCRNCPPVFQNPESGSWAQGCTRKHVHFPGPAPQTGGCCDGGMPRQDLPPQSNDNILEQSQDFGMIGLQQNIDPTLSREFTMDDLKMLDGEFGEFLNNDPEQTTFGCCSGNR